jgi:hypothetical protein
MRGVDLERAKELFFRYLGSRFLMSRDGVDEEYHSYGVSSEQQVAWSRELMNTLIEKLSDGGTSSFLSLVSFAQDYPNVMILDEVLRYVAEHLYEASCREDSLDKVIWAEGMTEIAKSTLRVGAVCRRRIQCIAEAVETLIRHVLENPIWVNEKWKRDYPFLDLDEAYVKERARRALTKARRLSNGLQL